MSGKPHLRWVLDCAIVGCATQVADILHLARTEHPNVVLLHEGLAEGDALEIASLLLQQTEQRGLFVLAASGTEERVFQFFLAGAAAYESRWIAPGDLVEKQGVSLFQAYASRVRLIPLAPRVQGVSLFEVCTIRMRRNLVASIAAKMSTKPLADCHYLASFTRR